jgi:activator of Hsp90 ATPase-like protein
MTRPSQDKMPNKSYTTTIEVTQSAEVVFNLINDVSKWWSKDFEGNSTNLGDEFVICHPGRHYSKQKLIEAVPAKKVVWLVTESELPWLEKDKHEWTNTKMVFDITAAEGKTSLHFTHEGLFPEKECYARCEQGWNMVIKERLFEFITDNKAIVDGRK